MDFKGTHKKSKLKIHSSNFSFFSPKEELISLTYMVSELLSIPHTVEIRSHFSENNRGPLFYISSK